MRLQDLGGRKASFSKVKHNENSKIPELPVEIWLRIMLFVKDPKPLSQTQKSLYTLCLNPVSSAKWLLAQYGKDALWGALWFWARNDVWRRWILKMKPHLPFAVLPVRSSTYFVKKAIKQFYKGWFYLSKRSRCKRCSTSALLETRYLETRDMEDKDVTDLKKSLSSRMSDNHCQFEHFQLRVCMLLMEEGTRPSPDIIKLLIRYSASVGHSKLLNYILALTSINQTFDPTFATEYELDQKYRDIVLELLKESIDAKKILNVYQCLETTNLTATLQPDQWRRLMSKIIVTFSTSLTKIFIGNNHTHLRVDEVEHSMRVANVPFLLSKSKRALRNIGLEMLKSVPRQLVMDEQAVFGLACCESGREDMVIYLHDQGVTFNHFDGLPLFNAALFGHPKTVKVLLEVCRVNPKVFQTGRVTVMNMLLIDHFALLFSLISSFASVVNEVYCRVTLGQGPNIGLFFIAQSGSLRDNICISDTGDSSPWASLLVFGFFCCAYAFLSTFVRLLPLLRSIYMIKRQIERNKKIAPAPVIQHSQEFDLESQSSLSQQ